MACRAKFYEKHSESLKASGKNLENGILVKGDPKLKTSKELKNKIFVSDEKRI